MKAAENTGYNAILPIGRTGIYPNRSVQQKEKMRIVEILILCFLVVGCSPNEYVDNKKMRASIDSLEISEIITEVETDSLGNLLDTISLTYLKYDDEKRKRYKARKYRYKDRELTLKDYYKPNEDLFYRESFNDEGESESIFETISNRTGRVVKAIQINKEFDPIDTTIMNYTHSFHPNGKVKELVIKAYHEEVGKFNSRVIYDKNEAPLFEVIIMDSDTMSYQVWEYSNSKLYKSIYTNYQIDTSKSIYYFGEGEQLIKEEEYNFKDGNYFKSKETNHSYDESNEKSESIEEDKTAKEVKYIKYLKEK
jgi:hypothetical protein